MMWKRRCIRILCPVLLLVVVSLACNLPGSTVASQADLDATATLQALATTVAQAQSGGEPQPGGPPPPEDGPPAPPGEPSPSPTITPTATATLSPTPGVPMVTVSVNTNCRFGPGKVYDYLGALLVGETTEVVGRSADGEYWVVKNPDKPGEICWLWGMYATVSGDTSGLPIMDPPPTPTPTANFTVAVDYSENCAGVWVVYLRIQNTGVDAFESVSATVEDFDLGESHTDSKDFFPVAQGCIVLAPPEKLDPGATSYHAVFDFSASPAAHNVRATVKLCTENGLGGNCVEKVVEDVVPAPSNVHLKTDIEPVDEEAVLEALMELPISLWRYKEGDPEALHMGPMAQDFHRLFGLGSNDTTISAIDSGGVALAGIQALNARLEDRNRQLADLESRLARLESRSATAAWFPLAALALGLAAGWWLRGRRRR